MTKVLPRASDLRHVCWFWAVWPKKLIAHRRCGVRLQVAKGQQICNIETFARGSSIRAAPAARRNGSALYMKAQTPFRLALSAAALLLCVAVPSFARGRGP